MAASRFGPNYCEINFGGGRYGKGPGLFFLNAQPTVEGRTALPAFSGAWKIEERWCGRRESNPHELLSPADFHAVYGFRRLDAKLWSACVRFVVWTIPSPCPGNCAGVRCCPSSLYTFPAGFGRAWLGIAMLQGSPTLSISASPVSRRALKFSLKSDASADFATPARFQR